MKAKEIYKMVKELMAEEGFFNVEAVFYEAFGNNKCACTVIAMWVCGKFVAQKLNKLDINKKDIELFVDMASASLRTKLFGDCYNVLD